MLVTEMRDEELLLLLRRDDLRDLAQPG
jgi:hypothetical protein